MKKHVYLYFVALLFSAVCNIQAWGQCTNTSQFGSATINPAGNVVTISTCSFAGEFSPIFGAVSGQTLNFTSSVAGDFITIRSGTSNGPVVASGNAPLSFVNTFTGTLFAHWNTTGCGSQSSCRTTTVQCTSCSAPPGPCTNISQFGSATINPAGNVVTISTCSFAGEFSPISGAVSGQTLNFTSSVAGDFITIRSGTSNGPVVASGNAPLSFVNTFTGTLFAHWNTTGCGSQSNCRITTVQCTSCLVLPCSPDITPPIITCPPNLVVGSTPGLCEATGTIIPIATATDNCGIPNIVRLSGPATGDFLPVGITVTSYRASDAAGNTSTCSRTITVNDTQAPTVTCPANTSVAVNISCQGTLGAYTASASDNCPGLSAVTQSPASGTPITGNTTVTMSATDAAGNTSACTFLVSVNDVTPPSITCPATQTLNLNASCLAPAGNYTGLAIVSDNCSLPVGAVTQTPVAGTNLANGANTITLRVTDGAGSTSTCTFSVIVADVTPPVITCPAPIVTTNTAGLCGRTVTYSITATDNCAAPSITLIAGLASGSFFPVGTNTASFRATDASGNSSTCSFTVVVNDTQAPTITCPAPIVTTNTAGLCGRSVTYSISATDNCSAPTITLIAGLASGSFFPVGTNTASFRATDASGNSSTCSFTIVVNDTELPTITCQPAKSVPSTVNQCGASKAVVIINGPLAFNDNCGIQSITDNAPAFFPVGVTQVTFVVTDLYGNSRSCQQAITVVDNQAPNLTCPENMTVVSTTFDCSAIVNYAAVASDNCGITSLEYSVAPGSLFEGGETFVTVSAFDAKGWESTCTFFVSVQAAKEVCDGVDNDCDGLTDEADNFKQVLKQLDAGSGEFDSYGNAVAIHENTAVVGVKLDDEKGFNAGAAYILSRSNGWAQVKKLTASDASGDDQFGNAVAIKGDYALVAANLRDDNGINTGAVYVFERNAGGAGNWGQIGKLVANDALSNANFGSSVSFDNDLAVVGANLDDQQGDNAGAAYVFDKNNNWAQEAKLVATDGGADDNFGGSVSNSGIFALVGARNDDDKGDNAGAAYLYRRSGTTWTQIKKLVAGNGAAGDLFGSSVDLSGLSAVVGAPRSDFKKNNGGIAYVFDKNFQGLDTWNESSKLFAYDSEVGEQLGYSVAVDGNLAAIGARYENAKGSGAGAIYTYLRLEDGVWIFIQKIVDPTGNLDDNMSTALDLSGRTIIAGAPRDDNGNIADQGTAQIYEDDCTGINLKGNDDDNNPVFGSPVARTGAANLRIYPIPVTDVLQIELTLDAIADANIVVMNTLGQTIAVVHNGWLEGTNTLQWRPMAGLAAGTYYIRIDAGTVHEVRPILLNKL